MSDTILSPDQRLFREAMSHLAAAVTIVTTDGAGGRHGFTASAVASVSDEPPTLLVCVNRNTSAHPHILSHGRLAVNVLDARHQDLSGVFADRSQDMTARFARGDWRRGEGGSPVLADALATFEGRVDQAVEVGSHTVVFARIERITVSSAASDGLVWFRRGYVTL